MPCRRFFAPKQKQSCVSFCARPHLVMKGVFNQMLKKGAKHCVAVRSRPCVVRVDRTDFLLQAMVQQLCCIARSLVLVDS